MHPVLWSIVLVPSTLTRALVGVSWLVMPPMQQAKTSCPHTEAMLEYDMGGSPRKKLDARVIWCPKSHHRNWPRSWFL